MGIACGHGRQNYGHAERSVIIDRILGGLMPIADNFDALAISGYSSAIMSSIIAHEMGKNIILVRKVSEVRVSKYEVEGEDFQRFIFLDDLIASGNTLMYVMEQIAQKLHGCICVGVATYLVNNAKRMSLIKSIVDTEIYNLGEIE